MVTLTHRAPAPKDPAWRTDTTTHTIMTITLTTMLTGVTRVTRTAIISMGRAATTTARWTPATGAMPSA